MSQLTLPWQNIDTVLLDLDGSLAVLEAAAESSIAHTVAISRPDSNQPARIVADWSTVEGLGALLPWRNGQ